MDKRRVASRGRNQRPAQAPPIPATPRPKTPPIQTPYERELTTKRRGEISELAFALAAARHGFGISRPYGDSERYDIILDPSHLDPHNPQVRPRLVRVQVKSSTQLQCGLYRLNVNRRINGLPSPTSSPKSISSPPTSSPKIPGSSSHSLTSSA